MSTATPTLPDSPAPESPGPVPSESNGTGEDKSTADAFEEFCSRHGLCGADDLKSARGDGHREYLIDGVFVSRQMFLFAGDSGIGKSPLLYQATICIAAGIPFLGLPTKQAAVLYLDYENSREDSAQIVTPMLSALGLSVTPPLWRVLNLVDAPGTVDPHDVAKKWLARPELQGMLKVVVIDPLEEWDDRCTDNKFVRKIYRQFRVWGRDYNTATITVHHIVKEPTRLEDKWAMAKLEGDPRRWLQRTHGGRVLTNASDVRIGMDEYRRSDLCEGPDKDSEVFIIAGYRRGRGGIGPIRVRREIDEEGEAICYRRCPASDLLPADQAAIYNALPASFETKDLKKAGVAHNQQCNRILRKWREMGIASQASRGLYSKVSAV